MLQNATLLQVDPPTGEPIAIRCALAAPTASEQAWLVSAGMTASAVVYLPLTGTTLPAIAVDGVLVIQLDGQSQVHWQVVHVSDRIGGVLRYKQVFVEESA